MRKRQTQDAVCQLRYRAQLLAAIVLLAVATSHPAWCQPFTTVSATGGWLCGPRSYIQCGTAGADVAWSWPVVHSDGHREPYTYGIKLNYARIPQGIAGDRLGLSGFATTPLAALNRITAPVDVSFQLGTGLGFYTRPYERTHDDANDFIGSYVNCVIDFGPVVTIPVHEGAIVMGAKFVHNSNGYLRKPNVGLNYLQGEVGWRLPLHGHKPGNTATDTLRFSRRYDAHTGPFVTLAPGFSVPRHDQAGNDVFFPAYTLQLGWRYAYQPCRSIGLATEFAYNFADDYGCIIHNETRPFPMFVSLAAMHETHWGPLSLRMGLGYYVWQSFPDGRIYERVGVFYNFGSQATQSVGIAIKANTYHADFIEWSYSFDIPLHRH